MDSALRPRDIQARIRAGESVEDVARAAGVPVERIDAFAAPVIAERDHVAGLALANPVRRRGESTSNRPLRTATNEQLIASGVDPDDVSWDAALLGARRWRVTARFAKGEDAHEAVFVFDVNGRFSVADNEEARRLVGEIEASPARQTGSDADDELALVRVVQGEPDESDAEVNDAYTETELAEVDGVYDIVPGDDPEMDALYDMLASFDEDSVRIYSGLVHPETFAPVLGDAPGTPSAETPDLPEGARVEPLYRPDDAEPATDSDFAGDAPSGADSDDVGVAPESDEGEGGAEASESSEAARANAAPIPDEPEQPAMVEGGPATPRPKPRPRNKRASVPSWDEIMFGAPRQGPEPRQGPDKR
mgnify:FL=1